MAGEQLPRGRVGRRRWVATIGRGGGGAEAATLQGEEGATEGAVYAAAGGEHGI